MFSALINYSNSPEPEPDPDLILTLTLATGTVLPIYWDKNNTASGSHVWPGNDQSEERKLRCETTFKYEDPASGRAM